ncbi:hypothetical protein E3P89_01643 [Wallemia ichthyophaga]|nr:hypothetical protein E3P95_01733 [Wallemia ichthyophaga]TIB01425.1 hypothetical protein E3P94_01848 [Wallemia ichthyophaga]TIB23330.1 hypothetical protein E3P89_01643 [Wallemia ichthyophaga]
MMPFDHQPHPHLTLQNDHPIHSHSFYSNILINSSSTDPIYPLPYVIRNQNGSLIVSCPSERQLAWGPQSENGIACKFFWMPFIGSLSFTNDAGNLNDISLSDMSSFFVNITLKTSASSNSSLRVPISRGSAFVTGIYSRIKPVLRSQLAFEDSLPSSENSSKQLVSCNDGGKWVIYTWPPIRWTKDDMHTLSPVNADDSWCGTVQIAKLSDEETSSVAIYDSFCGSWSEGMELKTSFPSAKSWVLIAELSTRISNYFRGTYCFKHKQNTTAKSTLFHLLPHHLNSLILEKGVKQERLSLSTPSNGPTSLVSSITGEFSFKHTLPSMQLQPQRFNFQSPTEGLWLEQTLREELSLDWLSKVSSEPSLYFAGKLVGRLANAVVIAYYVLSNHDLNTFASDILSSCLDLLLSDKRPFPLIYDTTIGGIISSAAHVTNDPLSDFGSSFYNDIHFHASYLVYAGAVLLSQQALSSDLKAKLSEIVNSVNSLKDTSQFCAHRAFDWYVGHSWARGLIPNTDGKDEESTSEAAHFYYSASLFAEGIGDTVQSLTARLQLAAMQTSTSHYRLLDDSNTCMPPRWRGNRVGMCFENKRDHGTWFSQDIHCIHGIHILPLSPITPYIRNPDFISQEFESHLRSVLPTNSGWDAVILTNWAFSSYQEAAKYVKYWVENAPDASFDPGLSRCWAWVLAASNIK